MNKRTAKFWLFWIVAALLTPGSGCAPHLVGTPNLLQHQDPQQVYADCPADWQSSDAAVLYATDRAVVDPGAKQPSFGFGRAPSLTFGVADVALNPQPSWKELTQDSTTARRSRDYALKVANVRADGQIQPLVEQAMLSGQGGSIVQAAAWEDQAAADRLQALLRQRLAPTTHKDVFIFVHGFNCTFDDSVFRAAEIWHFMGRVGVPVAYSWPAGFGGLRSYPYDRESGEYTVTHLRHFIKAVAECPGVERVHLIAHSRGCDVAMSALRELNLEITAQRKSTQRELKLENLVLAAPDVDEEVFLQRFVAENLLQAARRTTIYVSPSDKAIELSGAVFASRRMGALGVKDLSPKIKESLARMPNVQFIECNVSGLADTHNYVFTHPAALSDLILVLRDRRDPGAAHGRPLRQPSEGVWELNDDYLVKGR
jgi:esterase/lipase superfamily enzyme